MASKAQIQAQARYDKSHTKGIYLKLNTEYDADILEKLSKQSNVQGYIKSLIRDDINKSPD